MTTTDRLSGLESSTALKSPCRVATTAAITLSGLQTVDGIALAEYDRVLIKDQADARENGIWGVRVGAWVRAKDFDGSRDAVPGTIVFLQAGTINANFAYRVSGTSSEAVVIGTDDIEFEVAFSEVFDAADDTADALSATLAAKAATEALKSDVQAIAADVTADAAQVTSDAAQVAEDRSVAEGLYTVVVEAVIASIVDTPPAIDYAAGLAAVADGEAFYLLTGARRYYYIRIDSSNADIFAVTLDDRDLQKYAAFQANGDTESAPATLDIDFASVDALTRPAAVPNRAKGTSTLNLLASNRPSDAGVFDALVAFGAGIPTITRDYAGLITGSSALRVQYTASSAGILYFDVYIPAGRWSLVFNVKAASGTPAFRTSLDNGSTFGSHTASTSSVRKTQTQNFTTAAVRRVWLFKEAASPASADLTIDDIYIIPGDGSSVPTQFLGIAPTGDMVSAADGALIDYGGTKSTSAMHMLAPFGGAATSVTSYTICAAVRRTGAVGDNCLWSFSNSLDYFEDESLYECLFLRHIGASLAKQLTTINLPENEFIILGIVHTGTEARVYVDGIMLWRFDHALSAISAYGLSMFGVTTLNTNNFAGDAASFQARMNYAAGDGEMWRMANVAKNRIVSAGGSYRSSGIVPVFEGDSITEGFGANRGYANRAVTSYTPYIQAANYGTYGNTFAQIMARLHTHVIPICQRVRAAGKQPVVILLTGTNNMVDWTTNQEALDFVNSLATDYWDPLMDRDIPVIAATIPALQVTGGWTSAHDARRTLANTTISGLSSRYTALADYAGNANLNTWSGTYFADNAHPNDTGSVEMEGVLSPVLDPLVARYR